MGNQLVFAPRGTTVVFAGTLWGWSHVCAWFLTLKLLTERQNADVHCRLQMAAGTAWQQIPPSLSCREWSHASLSHWLRVLQGLAPYRGVQGLCQCSGEAVPRAGCAQWKLCPGQHGRPGPGWCALTALPGCAPGQGTPRAGAHGVALQSRSVSGEFSGWILLHVSQGLSWRCRNVWLLFTEILGEIK